jgi:hypothetical protein
VLPVAAEDPLKVMLPEVRNVQSSRSVRQKLDAVRRFVPNAV